MGKVNRRSMQRVCVLLLSFAAFSSYAAPIASNSIKLATFDGAKGTTFKWVALNDPVMGGASTSTFAVEAGVGVFNGTCRVVSFLHAPGFAKATTQNGWFHHDKFADVSAFLDGDILLEVRSSTPDYKGFKFEFGAPGIGTNANSSSHHHSGSFKAGFSLKGSDWQTVRIPFSSFSWDWSDFTGRCDTKDPSAFGRPGAQHHCCTKDHPEVCPKAKFLKAIDMVAIWAEGVAGDFHIEIKSIAASAAEAWF